LTSSAPSVTEGDSGTNNLVFTITLSAAATTATVVNYETLTTGTATAGTDFDAGAGSVSIAAGATSATVTVVVNGDADFEAGETVKVKFSGNDISADVTGTGTITNDDTDPATVAQAKTLTIGADTITAGTVADTFNASTASTLDTGDVLDGGTGSDTLTAAFSAAESIRPNLTSIETIKLTADAALTIDTRDITGTTLWTDESSTAAITLNNVATIPSLTINSNTGNAGATARNINFTDAAIVGTADNMTINLDNVDANMVITLDDAGGTTNELETVTLNSIGLANTMDQLVTTNVETSKVVITGDTALTISTAVHTKVLTVDASAATGAVTVTASASNTTLIGGTGDGTSLIGAGGNDTITAGSGNSTLAGGAGNDIITGGAGNDIISTGTGTTDVVAGGAGNDIITITDDAGTNVISNVDGGLGDDNIILADDADITATDIIGGGDGTDTLTVNVTGTILDAEFAKVTSIEVLKGPAAAAMTFSASNLASDAGINTITLGTAADNITIGALFTQPTLTVNLGSVTAADVVETVDASAYTGVLTVKTVGVSLGATSNDALTGTAKTTDTLSLSGVVADMAGVSGFETILINADTTSTVTLVTATVDDGKLLTIDGTAITTATKVLTADLSAEGNGQVTVLGGAGPDVITGSTSDLKDTLTGNGGADTFNFATGELTAIDVISGGEGTDIINMTGNVTIGDAAFTLVTGVEHLKTATRAVSVTLDDKAQAAGIETITTAGAAADAINLLAGLTSDVTINVGSTGATTITANTTSDVYTGDMTVAFADSGALTAADLIKGGSGTNVITLAIDATNNNDTATLDDAIGISTVTINDSTQGGMDTTFVLTHTADSTLAYTIDASSLDAAVTGVGAVTEEIATINLGDANNKGTYTVTTGGGSDVVTMSAGTDNITTNGGNDTIHVTGTYLTAADTISAGSQLTAGVDTLSLLTDDTLLDADFTLVTGIETLTATTDKQLIATLGAEAMEAGIANVIFTDTGAGTDKVTVAAAFTSALKVTLDNDASINTVDASASASTITVVIPSATTGDTAVLTGGTGSADILKPAAGTYAANANITGFEVLTSTGTGAVSITTADATVAADATLTVNLTASTAGAQTFVGSAETDGKFAITTNSAQASIITLGQGDDTVTVTGTGTAATQVTATDGTNTITTVGGADIIIMGGGADSVTTGSGDDIIRVAGASLTAGDTISAGTATTGDADTLSLDGASTVIDSDFTNVTGIETLTETGADAALTLTLGSKAAAAGVTTVVLSTGDIDDTVTVGAAFTNNLAVTLGLGDDTISAAAYTKALTITTTADAVVAGADTITGGTGTDTLNLIGGTIIVAAGLAGVTKFEKITITSDINSSVILSDNNTAAGATLTLSAAGITTVTKTATLDGDAEVDGNLIIIGSAGVDTITGGALADTIKLGSADDADDVIKLTDSTMDTVYHFEAGASGDQFEIDLSDLTTGSAHGFHSSATDFVILKTGVESAQDGTTAVQSIADQNGGAAVAVDTNAIVFLLVGTTFATTDLVEDALETGDYELDTLHADNTSGDTFFVIWSDGTDAFIGSARIVTNVGTDFATGDLSVSKMVKLVGNAAITTGEFHLDNFDVIA